LADDRSRSQILQANEKTKVWSSVVANLGTALFASGFGRWWLTGFDPWVIVWIVGGGLLIFVGIHLLTFLDAES
jgi:hypothetical protein